MTISRTTGRFARRTLAVAALATALAGCGALKGDGPEKTPTLGERMPILSKIETGAKVDPALAGVAVTLPAQQVNAEWAQAGGSASKSYGHLSLAASPVRAWTASIAGSSSKQRLAAAPVVGEGRLFVFDTDGVVHAFDAQSGARVWQHSLEVKGDGSSSVFGGGASYEGGKVYVTTGVGQVAALDAATGAEVWSVKPAGPLRGAPTIAFGALYVMTQDNQVISLDLADGSVQWTEAGSQGQSGLFGVASPAAGQGTVIAGFSSGELIAYRYENGRNLWADALARTSISTSVGILTDIDADPIIDGGNVYALGQGGRMAAYELVTGQRVWELNLAGISTPAVGGNWLFVITDDAKLMAIARATGKVRWIADLPKYRNEKKEKDELFWSGPVLAGGRLWVTNTEGDVYAVDATSGVATPFADLDEAISLAPIVANNTLYVLDDSGKITAWR
ncbi:outer membrane protein assembly factor BamB family protein [Croceicoccus naphthovorans]|uniref:Pyrrolo-quinoline quinone n=1 Tax=Croceicoccus naphthovorans TaxID=1348774 RepID=A0A0G3XJK2_9SPHN|nr:PQQ-binding-like beta-propeller repeat protein [Croceicoccus naphthovorans]AKM10533.1 pyrrolo-quinoline quinone [Croceicoccus naphthovorans]